MSSYPLLFSPLQLPGLLLPNRVVMAAMSSGLADPNGMVTSELIAYYRERAMGGTGLITVEYNCVEPRHGRSHTAQLVLDSPKHISGQVRLVDAIKEMGVAACIQLHHAGCQTKPDHIAGNQPVAPSEVHFQSSFGLKSQARALEVGEIETLVEKFSRSAELAVRAGYDAVELHGAHGYLLGQFLSPLTNRRDDAWGGDFERRMAFPLAVIRAVKAAIGADKPLIYRLSAAEFIPGGLTIEDMEKVAPQMAQAGADVLHVSTGTFGSLEYVVEPMSMPEGWRLPLARRIREAAKVPVIAVGMLRDPKMAEQALSDGDADLIALGRPLLVDPHWTAKVQQAREAEIRPCTSCNWCTNHSALYRQTGCAENPRAGRETEVIPDNYGRGRKAVVVGAGPGGIVSALLLDQYGFSVSLLEARADLGGGLVVSGAPPLKGVLLSYLDYLKDRLHRSNVSTKTGAAVRLEDVLAMKPDVLVVAAGASPRRMEFEGVDSAMVRQAYDLLAMSSDSTPSFRDMKMLVYGGGETGCETAEYIAERGGEVVLVTRSPRMAMARSAEPLYRKMLLDRLNSNPRVGIVDNSHIVGVEDGKVHLRGRDGATSTLSVDGVYLAQGQSPVPFTAGMLGSIRLPVVVIGDSRKVGRIGDAVNDAYAAVKVLAERLRPSLNC